MTEFAHLARPYAKALFDLAVAEQKEAEWSNALALLACIARDETMQRALKDPRLTPTERASVFCDVAGEQLTHSGRRLVRLLAERYRLVVLPMIEKLFRLHLMAFQKKAQVLVVTAQTLDPSQQKQLEEALARRLQREVVLRIKEDARLLAGVRVHIGDKVIDGSVQGQLDRLHTMLQ